MDLVYYGKTGSIVTIDKNKRSWFNFTAWSKEKGKFKNFKILHNACDFIGVDYDTATDYYSFYKNSENTEIMVHDLIPRNKISELPKKDLANRFNDGKLQWSLVDYPSLEDMVRVLEFGANKYSKDQWKQGMEYRTAVESLLRHVYAFLNGEDNDPESGLPHTGHILCNAMFLSYNFNNKKELDNRYGKEIA